MLTPTLIKGIWGEIGDLSLRQYMQALVLVLSKINDWIQKRLPINLTTPTHPYKPGDAIWVKENLIGDPFFVILSTPTAVEVGKIGPWSHHS
jgi:hypothetical protein